MRSRQKAVWAGWMFIGTFAHAGSSLRFWGYDMNKSTVLIAWILGAAASGLLPRPAMATPSVGCSADEPCFKAAYQAGSKVIFDFSGVRGWDFYNVRYAVAGGEKQVENRTGRFTFNNIRPNRSYTLSVQGCRSRTLQRSVCSAWVAESVVTR